MREIVQIINEGEERITSDESEAKTIISYFNESDTASEKKKRVMTVSVSVLHLVYLVSLGAVWDL